MAQQSIDPQSQDQNIQSGPEIVAEFVRKTLADEGLDKDTVNAVKVLYGTGKLTTINLLKILENVRGQAKHGSLTKT